MLVKTGMPGFVLGEILAGYNRHRHRYFVAGKSNIVRDRVHSILAANNMPTTHIYSLFLTIAARFAIQC